MVKKTMSSAEREELIARLKIRFRKNTDRHPEIDWEEVEAKLRSNEDKLWSIGEMEKTGGEPDVIGPYREEGIITFCDCSAESPKGRRSLCYDREALESRKANKPENSAVDMAADMGVELLTESAYRELQELGPFDQKTSSWLATPSGVREKGGALFGDYRYGRVFIYHNGAPSYYAARGFRGVLSI